MCTVIYIPQPGKFCFASLRDEDPQRARALEPALYPDEKGGFIASIDPTGGGTWLGVSVFGTVIILLNGEFSDHKKRTDYTKSRGLIAKELLPSAMPVVDWLLLDLEGIEPFTLVVFENGRLFQLVWNGKIKTRLSVDETIAHIWSSSTLYDKKSKQKRQALFTSWIAKRYPVNKDSVMHFFCSVKDAWNGFFINRNEKVKTLSYTFVELDVAGSAKVQYVDFINQSENSSALTLVPSHQPCVLINS